MHGHFPAEKMILVAEFTKVRTPLYIFLYPHRACRTDFILVVVHLSYKHGNDTPLNSLKYCVLTLLSYVVLTFPSIHVDGREKRQSPERTKRSIGCEATEWTWLG